MAKKPKRNAKKVVVRKRGEKNLKTSEIEDPDGPFGPDWEPPEEGAQGTSANAAPVPTPPDNKALTDDVGASEDGRLRCPGPICSATWADTDLGRKLRSKHINRHAHARQRNPRYDPKAKEPSKDDLKRCEVLV